jgi:transposase
MKNKILKPKVCTQRIKGILYAFEDFPYWDVQKRQMRHRRNYIGKLDSNGELVPNKAYASRLQMEKMLRGRQDIIGQSVASREYYGAPYLLDVIGERTGVVQDLKTCFPDSYLKILSLAYYLILESDSPVYRFKKWASTHQHPLGTEFPSQRISEFFGSITEEAKMAFFRIQSKRRMEKEYLAYDTTSISSYSELIDHARYGHNKDGDALPQINLALIFGEESMLPVYYRKLPGNITDVQTVRKLLKDIVFLEMKRVKLVMDRGFYSAMNINELYQHHHKFLIGARVNTVFITTQLDEVREIIKDFRNYSTEHDIYCLSRAANWTYMQPTRGGKFVKKSKRIYVHLYYNGQKAEEEKANFIRMLAGVERVLQDGSGNEEQKTFGGRYFLVEDIDGSPGKQIEHNDKAIRERLRRCGYFALLSNELRDAKMALRVYRNKDVVEKAFYNLKNRLDMKKTAVSTSENLEGKLFVQFIALIYISYIHKRMKEKGLYENYSMQTLLDELDIIERFKYPDCQVHYSEMTQKQLDLFTALEVPPPNML